MAANAELKLRCPSCGTKYKVPAKAVGQKVRCAKCQNLFRITDSRGDSHRPPPVHVDSVPSRAPSSPPPVRPKGTPSEEDILRWLSEADDDASRERRTEMSADDSLYGTDNPLPPETDTPPVPPTIRMTRGNASSSEPLAMRRVV